MYVPSTLLRSNARSHGKRSQRGETGTEIQFYTLAHFPALVNLINLMNLHKAVWVDEVSDQSGALQDQECNQSQRWLLLHKMLRLLFKYTLLISYEPDLKAAKKQKEC